MIPNCSFQLYLRLFVVMGLTYSISALSYLVFRSSICTEWCEIFLSLQGVWIFLLFVLKRRVFHLIKERCVCALKSSQHSNRTVATTYIWSVCFGERNRSIENNEICFSFYNLFFIDLDGVEEKAYLLYKEKMKIPVYSSRLHTFAHKTGS